MCLVNRVIDPPLIALVDIYENQLSGDILPFVVRSGSLSKIHQGKFLRSIGNKRRLVSAKLDLVMSTIFTGVGKNSFFKFPAIDFDGIFSHIGKANGFHFLFQHFTGLKLGAGTGRTVAQNRIGAKLLHTLGQPVGVIYIKVFQNGFL